MHRADHEHVAHISILTYLETVLPAHAVVWHTPNGGKRPPGAAGQMKGLGAKAGIPDLFCLVDGQLLAFEIKAKNGRLSPEQAVLADRLIAADARWSLVRSIDDVRSALRRWNITTREAAR